MNTVIRILGIDPGLRRTGWGVIEVAGTRLRHIANGTVTSPANGGLPIRLTALYSGLEDVLGTHGPHEAAVEETFVNRDGAATLKLGQARAVALLVPARAGLRVSEYAPNTVKKAVVGVGHADKTQVQAMLNVLLPGAALTGPDAADALAIAICHAHHREARDRIAAAEARANAGGRP